MSEGLKDKTVDSFIWKTGQSVCSLGMTFVIQLVLARILSPEEFGIIALTTVAMTLANTIIETSFSSSVIQREYLNEKLISSIFYANFILSIILYCILFCFAPVMASFYQKSILAPILRIQGLRIILSGIYSIPQAFLNRKMKFKTLFYCSLAGSIGQAVIGFSMAYAGAGVWALVYSTLGSCIINGILIIIVESWNPSIYFSFSLVKDALSFSSKILVIRVMRKLFYNIRVLVIGKVYSTAVLGCFNKGFQFPSTVMTVVDGSITSVSFTTLSKLQNNRKKFLDTVRLFIRCSMFVCVPLMVGLALVARPLVLVLLTEKWIACVPFLQIICFTQILLPLNVKTTAFEALGKSDLSMRLHGGGIILSIISLLISMRYSALVMTVSGLISNIILQISIAVVAKYELDYRFIDQVRDTFCGLVPTIVMTWAVVLSGMIDIGVLAKLIVEVLVGIVGFILTASLTKNKVFLMLWDIMKMKLLRSKRVN